MAALGGRRGPRETSFYFVRVMAVESGLCISPGALPGPDLLRAIPGVLRGATLGDYLG